MSEQIKESMNLKMELKHPPFKHLDKVCWDRVSWLSLCKSFLSILYFLHRNTILILLRDEMHIFPSVVNRLHSD